MAFLQRLYRNELPFRVEHQRLVKDVMIVEAGRDWILRAKTGWQARLEPQVGWWVGWVEWPQGPVFFALNIEMPGKGSDLPKREAIARAVLRSIDALPSESAPPAIEETMKWGIPHFTHHGILCSMAAFKQHCSFGFWKHALVVKDGGERGAGAMGSFGRIVVVSDLPSRKVLVGYVRTAMRLNADGVKLPTGTQPKHRKDLEMPDVLRSALDRNPQARAAFERFSPSQRYEYIEWIAEAKRADTRERRLATAIDWVAEGKPRHWKYAKC